MTSTAANVENKVILITGGAQGIGGAAAQLCAQRGAEVIITDIKDETGEAENSWPRLCAPRAARPATQPWMCAATRTRSGSSRK